MSKPADLAMHPAGLGGALFATVMERTNKPAYDRAAELIAPQPGQAILEIGFGTGALLDQLARTRDVSLAAVDATAEMVERARRRPGLRRMGHRADLREGRDAPLPWPDRGFDAVVSVHAFQFWAEPARSITEMRRVLKTGGRLVLVLRDHSHHAPDWLPNPISRSGDEVQGALAALAAGGFHAAQAGRVGSSHCLLARAPGEATTA